MTAIVSDQRNLVYSRDYTHDSIPLEPSSWGEQIQRVALVAMPFLSLHAPFRQPISLLTGSMRVWHMASDLYNCQKNAPTIAYHLVQTTVSVAALGATLFAHSAGLILTALQDLSIETTNLVQLLQTGQLEEALKSSIKLASHVLYVTVLCYGGLELSIVSLAMQAVVLVLSSVEQFQKDRWLEGCANLLMAGIRINQAVSQYGQLKRNWEIQETIRRRFVGELHEKWQFPSDHLPIGIEVDGVRIISWNVLNNAYLDWVIVKDSQGLNGSLISDLNQVIGENGLTHRDLFIAEMVVAMTESGHIIALQECGEPFVQALKDHLPEDWQLLRSFETPQKNQEVILYNTTKLAYQAHLSEVSRDTYPSAPKRPLQNAYFSQTEEGKASISLFNLHIPGDPKLPAREEEAAYVHKKQSEGIITVAVGDNNFERGEMLAAYLKAGFSEFSLHAPWKTNIDPDTKEAKAIDIAFVGGASHSRDLRPEEILGRGDILQKTIALLNR
jgi:hypothetical protein